LFLLVLLLVTLTVYATNIPYALASLTTDAESAAALKDLASSHTIIAVALTYA
jgi:hypothetical protein